MPRKPDAKLEERVIVAAKELWDQGGEAAITLRAVAKQAGTTTPSIYQRFQDREELLECLVAVVTEELVAAFSGITTVEKIFRQFVKYCEEHPMRLGLMVTVFGTRMVTGQPMPVIEMLQGRIREELGLKQREAEDLALAIASLAFGTAQGSVSMRKDPQRVKRLQRTSMGALKILLATFRTQGAKSRRRKAERRG